MNYMRYAAYINPTCAELLLNSAKWVVYRMTKNWMSFGMKKFLQEVKDMRISLLSTHNRQNNPVRSSYKDTIVSHIPLQAEICSSFVDLLKNLWTRSDVHTSY